LSSAFRQIVSTSTWMRGLSFRIGTGSSARTDIMISPGEWPSNGGLPVSTW